MANAKFYLRQDVQAEPLVGGWFAWVHMVPPATAAFNVVERQIRAMESFVRSPGLHAASIRNPALRGGRFLDLAADRSEAVESLLAVTRARAGTQTAFVTALRALGAMLLEECRGGSMESIYARVPEPLRGYVELFYDRHDRPDFRLLEALLYRSPLYEPGLQSIVLKTITGDRDRPFVFSTPRLADRAALDLPIDFASKGAAALFQARTAPVTLSALRDALGVDILPEQEQLFLSFFTDHPPPPPAPRFAGMGHRIRYFGHACLLVETAGACVLFDPLFNYAHAGSGDRFTYLDLPEHIDHIVITHGHHDHVVLEALLQLRGRVGQIIVPRNVNGALQDPSLALMLRAIGFPHVATIGEFETLRLGPDEELTGLPFVGEHHDLLVDSKLTYHLRLGRSSVLVASDSCNIAPDIYENVCALVGPVDTLFLGMECDGAPLSWVYGPLLDQSATIDNDRARRGRSNTAAEGLELIRRFTPSHVYVYAMGAEPWVRYLLDVDYEADSRAILESDQLIAACVADGRTAERLYLRREVLNQ